MSDTFKLLFRGDIAPGHSLPEVRERIGGMFNLDAARVDQFFSGRPVVLKKSLSAAEAEKWTSALLKAGIVVEVATAESGSSGAETPATGTADDSNRPGAEDAGGWTIEPPGADVLRPGERHSVAPVNVSTDHLSLDAPGADVLRPGERREFEALQIDLSHLRLEDL